jgi:hypothetical protein
MSRPTGSEVMTYRAKIAPDRRIFARRLLTVSGGTGVQIICSVPGWVGLTSLYCGRSVVSS